MKKVKNKKRIGQVAANFCMAPILAATIACGGDTDFAESKSEQIQPEEKEQAASNSSDAVAVKVDPAQKNKEEKETASNQDIVQKNEQEESAEEIQTLAFTQSHTIGNELDYTPVDIVFVVDSSGSMKQEQKILENLMRDFLKQLTESPLPLDFQVFVVGDRFNFPETVYSDSRFELVNVGVRSFDALDKAARFLNREYATNLSIRERSYKEVIVITDDDARRVTDENFFDLTSKDNLTLHGLVGFEKGQNPDQSWCNIMNVGESYKKLAEATQGILHDLCDDSWDGLFERLVRRMIQRLATAKVALTHIPADPSSISVKFKGFPSEVEVSYLRESNSILFDSSVAPIPGIPIEIYYEYVVSSQN